MFFYRCFLSSSQWTGHGWILSSVNHVQWWTSSTIWPRKLTKYRFSLKIPSTKTIMAGKALHIKPSRYFPTCWCITLFHLIWPVVSLVVFTWISSWDGEVSTGFKQNWQCPWSLHMLHIRWHFLHLLQKKLEIQNSWSEVCTKMTNKTYTGTGTYWRICILQINDLHDCFQG